MPECDAGLDPLPGASARSAGLASARRVRTQFIGSIPPVLPSRQKEVNFMPDI